VKARIEVAPALGLAARLEAVQRLLARGDERAGRVFETLGVYLGYAIGQSANPVKA
jgi:hypothetical protein